MIGHFIHGHGPERALVLHGWFGDWRVFEPMLTALDESRFSFAFMDYRGYGMSKTLGGGLPLAATVTSAAIEADCRAKVKAEFVRGGIPRRDKGAAHPDC